MMHKGQLESFSSVFSRVKVQYLENKKSEVISFGQYIYRDVARSLKVSEASICPE